MIPLCSELPESVEICGKRYAIRWDHRTHIKISELLRDNELSEHEKCMLALNLFYPVQPPDALSALREMTAFYRGPDCRGESRGSGGEKENTSDDEISSPPLFSFKYDSARICASFQSEYGIDLTSEKLHWWRFLALLLSLPPDSAFGRAVTSRVMPCPLDATSEQRAAWRAYRDFYRLPKDAGEFENDRDFAMRMAQFF